MWNQYDTLPCRNLVVGNILTMDVAILGMPLLVPLKFIVSKVYINAPSTSHCRLSNPCRVGVRRSEDGYGSMKPAFRFIELCRTCSEYKETDSE